MTPDLLDRHVFLRLGTVLGWPHVNVGRLTFGTELEWDAAVNGAPPLTATERAQALQQLHPVLLRSTEGGRARLEAAEAAAGGSALDPALAEVEVKNGLAFYGDAAMLAPAVGAFCRLPPPVRDVLLGEVAVLAVGRTSHGWTSSARLVDRAGETRQRLVVLAGHRADDEVLRTTLHELGHCWLAALPHEDSQAITAQCRAAVLDLAEGEGWADRASAFNGGDELKAEALATCWAMEAAP